jgi:hypothetical protein
MHIFPNEGDSQLVLGSSLLKRGASQSAEASLTLSGAATHGNLLWVHMRREHGFDSTSEYMELTGQPLSLSPSCASSSEVKSLPAKSVHPSSLTPLLKCPPLASCLKQPEHNLSNGMAKKVTLCEEVDWLILDDDLAGEKPVPVTRPLRADGCTQKLVPRSIMRAQMAIADGDPFLLGVQDEKLDLPRCTSFAASADPGDELPWFHNSRSGVPLALIESSSLRESSSFSCACSSVSTADEWSRPIYVE